MAETLTQTPYQDLAELRHRLEMAQIDLASARRQLDGYRRNWASALREVKRLQCALCMRKTKARKPRRRKKASARKRG